MKHILILTALLVAVVAKAQLPADFRSEQIYLSLEKHTYMPGDTISLEGQVVCDAAGRFLPYSNYLYIECLDGRDSLLVRQKLRCKDRGYFNTRMVTEFEWPNGVYYLRAYTQLMRNFSDESFTVQPVLLGEVFPKKEEQVYEARCTVLPSGGKLLAGQPQTATVLLTDECTFPVSAELLLMDESGDTIAPVHTSASGMDLVSFIPQAGKKYHLKGQIDGVDYTFPLPETVSGIKVQGILNRQRLNYQVLGGGEDLTPYRLFTYDRLNGLMELPAVKGNGIIVLDQAPRTLTLFLTDRDINILSEYTVASRTAASEGLTAPNSLTIGQEVTFRLPEQMQNSRTIVRVLPENDLLATHAEDVLLYQTDFRSVLPFPRHLHTTGANGGDADLQAWLSTARFKRFDLKEAVTKDSTLYVYLPEQVMSFTGQIEKTNKTPFGKGELVAYHTDTDFVYEAELYGNGKFQMAVDDFLEGETFFLQAINSKEKPSFANYRLDDETYPALANHNRFTVPKPHYAQTEVTIGNDFNLDYTVDKGNVRNYKLPNVTVKARVRTEAPKPTHEFYSTNYADREEIEERAYNTLLDILRDMPGIRINQVMVPAVEKEDDSMQGIGAPTKSGGGSIHGNLSGGGGGVSTPMRLSWSIGSTRGGSTFRRSKDGMPILVDGVRFTKDDYDHILYMPAQEIESAQVLRAWQTLAYTFGAIDGAILVKTRSSVTQYEPPTKGAFYSPMGISKLSNTFEPQPWKADKPGRYRLLVDVFTDTGVQSYEHPFEVVE